jgi:hypothetical protein
MMLSVIYNDMFNYFVHFGEDLIFALFLLLFSCFFVCFLYAVTSYDGPDQALSAITNKKDLFFKNVNKIFMAGIILSFSSFLLHKSIKINYNYEDILGERCQNTTETVYPNVEHCVKMNYSDDIKNGISACTTKAFTKNGYDLESVPRYVKQYEYCYRYKNYKFTMEDFQKEVKSE